MTPPLLLATRARRRVPAALLALASAAAAPACGPGTDPPGGDGAMSTSDGATRTDATTQPGLDARSSDALVSGDTPPPPPPSDATARDVMTLDRATPPPPDASGVDVSLPPAPSDPAMRLPAHICPRWNADVAASTGVPAWMAGATMCAAGTLAPATVDAAVRMTNTFRWLAGLNAVPANAMYTSAAQACAVLIQANGMLNHTPPMSWTCWSALGYDGTSHSNIMGGGGGVTPMSAIAGWIDDSRDISMTLGHRRWMLWPPLGPIGYGQARSYACLYVIGSRGTGSKPWVAWPNEGPTPIEAMTNIWSFSSSAMGVSATTRVSVTRDGASVPVSAMLRANGYGDPTVSWNMSGITAGATYHVTVTGLSMGRTVEYDVRPVRCAGM